MNGDVLAHETLGPVFVASPPTPEPTARVAQAFLFLLLTTDPLASGRRRMCDVMIELAHRSKEACFHERQLKKVLDRL